jgi:AraC-like DNA-binding protein
MGVMREDLTVSGAQSAQLLLRMERLGVDVRAVCEDAGLDHTVLSSPDGRVPRDAIALLWQHAVARTGDENLGLRVATVGPPSMMSLFIHMFMSGPTPKEALQRILPYQRVFTAGPALGIEEREEDFVITLARLDGDVPSPPQMMEHFLAACIRMISYAVGEPILPRSASFRHPEPASTDLHQEVFRCPIHFNAEADSLVMSKKDMERRSLHGSDSTLQRLERSAEEILQAIEDPSVAGRARAVVRARLGGAPVSLNQVASELRMSARTLQRRLSEEKTSFRRVIDEARKALVLEAADAGESMAALAQRAGFSNSRAFARAFRRWTT